MKALSTEMIDALSGAGTTICNVWIITRADGEKVGLTDHDQVLVIDGVACDPTVGADRTNLEATIGANSDTANLTGVLASEKIEEQDIINGKFDDAQLEHFIVNWREPDINAKIRTYSIGEITRQGAAFVVELRGASSLFSRPHGRLYARSCSAVFCDQECALNDDEFLHQANLVDLPSRDTFQIEQIDGVDPYRFVGGLARFPEDGSEAVIETVIPLAVSVTLSCRDLGSVSISVPSQVILLEGCDRTFGTCRDRFSNAINFRGFPHLPGNQQILNYIDEETRHDGTPIVP